MKPRLSAPLSLLTLGMVASLLSGCANRSSLRPLDVAAVTVEVGVGSPIPLEIVASGDWPDLCAQLAEVTSQLSGSDIRINLLATPPVPSCPPDNVGIPFRIAIPLNPVELRQGTYNVTVNSATATFVWPPR